MIAFPRLFVRSITQHFSHEKNDNGAADAAPTQQVNQRVSDRAEKYHDVLQ